MLQENGADFHLYQKKIIEFGSLTDQLSDFSQIIWLNQYPVLELYGPSDAYNTAIHSKKIYSYNEAVRLIFR
jgi:hypothetical protein